MLPKELVLTAEKLKSNHHKLSEIFTYADKKKAESLAAATQPKKGA
jgi:hypothetical protein